MGWEFFRQRMVHSHFDLWYLTLSLSFVRFDGQFTVFLSWLCWSLEFTWLKDWEAVHPDCEVSQYERDLAAHEARAELAMFEDMVNCGGGHEHDDPFKDCKMPAGGLCLNHLDSLWADQKAEIERLRRERDEAEADAARLYRSAKAAEPEWSRMPNRGLQEALAAYETRVKKEAKHD